jgi:hypothetical protein
MTFGEPFEASNGTVVITVSGQDGRAVGVFSVAGENATWTPTVDNNRVALIAVCTGFVAAALGAAAVLRRPPWPELTERSMIAIAESKAAGAKH